MIEQLTEKLRAARSVVLSTHRHCDGDGLGAQLALFHALTKLGKETRVLNVDRPPKKYAFLGTDQFVGVYSDHRSALKPTDLALILDTNDERLVEPLFTDLKTHCREVLFVDHHPILEKGPKPTAGSVIDVNAASTGEIAYSLIKALGCPLDAKIARGLYTSIAFDTQMFRYVKSDPRSHLIAAELLAFEREPEEVHRRLFATHTVEKMGLLARALAQVEYFDSATIACIRMSAEDFRSRDLGVDESGDVIDLIMQIESVVVAALLREDEPGKFKLSLRSTGPKVLPVAESFGGGGHAYAAGAFVPGNYEGIRDRILGEIRRSPKA